MIRSITQPKPEAEIDTLLAGLERIFIVGCGTCTTLTHTGGAPETENMAQLLGAKGKLITGRLVAPVACDNLTAEILAEYGPRMAQSDGILVMSCAYGVQNIARAYQKMVIPALNTLFIGKESGYGQFDEVCTQCGTCIIGETGGICPVTACHKGMVNGPCGGTNNGKCEIDANKDCAWTRIYLRLKDLGRLNLMRRLQPLRNHLGEPTPGKLQLAETEN